MKKADYSSKNGPRNDTQIGMWAQLRTDGDFDFAAAGFHAFESLWQISKADLFGDEIVSRDIAALDGFERFADEARGVVER